MGRLGTGEGRETGVFGVAAHIEDAEMNLLTVIGVRGTKIGDEGWFGVGQVRTTDGIHGSSER